MSKNLSAASNFGANSVDKVHSVMLKTDAHTHVHASRLLAPGVLKPAIYIRWEIVKQEYHDLTEINVHRKRLQDAFSNARLPLINGNERKRR